MKEDLIEQVAAEVLRRAAPQRSALLLGRRPGADLGWRYVLSGAFDAVMIGSLSAAQLLQFPDEASAEALLLLGFTAHATALLWILDGILVRVIGLLTNNGAVLDHDLVHAAPTAVMPAGCGLET